MADGYEVSLWLSSLVSVCGFYLCLLCHFLSAAFPDLLIPRSFHSLCLRSFHFQCLSRRRCEIDPQLSLRTLLQNGQTPAQYAIAPLSIVYWFKNLFSQTSLVLYMAACPFVQARTMDVGEIPPPITPEHNPPFVPVRGRICLISTGHAASCCQLEKPGSKLIFLARVLKSSRHDAAFQPRHSTRPSTKHV